MRPILGLLISSPCDGCKALRDRWPAAFGEEIIQRFTQQFLDTGILSQGNLAQLSGHGRVKVASNRFGFVAIFI
jgi:hypothetical protein